jgi:hypothetical protein
MTSIFFGVFALYLFVVLFMVVAGPLVMLLERRRRRSASGKPGTGHGA